MQHLTDEFSMELLLSFIEMLQHKQLIIDYINNDELKKYVLILMLILYQNKFICYFVFVFFFLFKRK